MEYQIVHVVTDRRQHAQFVWTLTDGSADDDATGYQALELDHHPPASRL
jgi:hypothetical protein